MNHSLQSVITGAAATSGLAAKNNSNPQTPPRNAPPPPKPRSSQPQTPPNKPSPTTPGATGVINSSGYTSRYRTPPPLSSTPSNPVNLAKDGATPWNPILVDNEDMTDPTITTPSSGGRRASMANPTANEEIVVGTWRQSPSSQRPNNVVA
jgi:hypothetical protein